MNGGLEDVIQYRLAKARDALADARYLYEGGRSPQSILNRSYYAMFYAASALLHTIGNVPAKHAGVITRFDTEFMLKGVFPKEHSKNFHEAFDLRQVSDYRMSKKISRDTAFSTLQKAEQFVEAIHAYLDAKKY